MTSIPAPSSYRKLVTDIALLYESARKALVEAYWSIGQKIVEVEQKGDIKAAYGTGLLVKLSRDLTAKLGAGFSERQLYGMRQFYLTHKISPPAAELSWTQHVELLRVNDVKKRKALESRAIRGSLKRDEIRELVRRERVRERVAAKLRGLVPRDSVLEGSGPAKGEGRETSPDLLVSPKDLTLHTYKKAELPGGTGFVLDCGFYVYREVTKAQYEGATVTDKPAYAYEATVERVVDGDTLTLVIDVGFGTQVREKVRLRGIDCPELGTQEGDAAKRFAMKLLPIGANVVIRSSKSDKYGRFIGDIFYTDKEGEQRYLNNEILKAGLAVPL